MDRRQILILTGGDPTPVPTPEWHPDAVTVIAADSGLGLAAALGVSADLVVGDMDSVDPAALVAAERAGAQVQRHPVAKDATDLELALDAALAMGPADVTVVGGHGGRLDHFLGNALLLAAERYAPLTIQARMGGATVTVVRAGTVELAGGPGGLISLLPVHGPAYGVRTEGLRFPLRDEDLLPGLTRGVSNVFESTLARVSLRSGVLLAVQP